MWFACNTTGKGKPLQKCHTNSGLSSCFYKNVYKELLICLLIVCLYPWNPIEHYSTTFHSGYSAALLMVQVPDLGGGLPRPHLLSWEPSLSDWGIRRYLIVLWPSFFFSMLSHYVRKYVLCVIYLLVYFGIWYLCYGFIILIRNNYSQYLKLSP